MDRETTRRSSGSRNYSGNSRKKSKKAKRIQRLVILLVLVLIFITLLVVVGLHLYQKWEARYDSNTSVIFILEDGQIVTNDVVMFDTSKYSQDELNAFIEETIDTYNKEHGEDSVVQESFEIDNNVASLILTYKDAATYTDFSGTEMYVGTISDAVAKGYKFEGQFASIVDGRAVACSIDKFYGQSELKVAIVKANTKISVEGEILYVSTENVAQFGENWIITKDGYNLLENGQTQSSQNSETGTESELDSEEVDGSVDATELVTEETETSTEIIFDFGDEDSTEILQTTYSEVYAYIIYK